MHCEPINRLTPLTEKTAGRRRIAIALCCAMELWSRTATGQNPAQDSAQQFRSALSTKVQMLEKQNTAAVAGIDGWLFLTADLRFLSTNRFWGEDATAVSRASKSDWADPVPAIVDFNEQLKKRGIQLLVVPVPSKAEIYPETIVPELPFSVKEAATLLEPFCDELRTRGIEVLDLSSRFLELRASEHEPLFCKTDTHWSGTGCLLAAKAIAERLEPKLGQPPSRKVFASDWIDLSIDGDLAGLLVEGTPKPGPEKIRVRSVTDKVTGAGLAPDANSPVLLLGDSFTLVFHDFYATNAGLIDQLAVELGFVPDLIGTRGSGATPVRISLYRRTAKDPEYLAKKKFIVWCFAARELTEAVQGWQKLPVSK